MSWNCAAMCFIVFKSAREDSGFACFKNVTYNPRLISPTEAGAREANDGGRVFGDANAVRAYPPLYQFVEGGCGH